MNYSRERSQLQQPAIRFHSCGTKTAAQISRYVSIDYKSITIYDVSVSRLSRTSWGDEITQVWKIMQVLSPCKADDRFVVFPVRFFATLFEQDRCWDLLWQASDSFLPFVIYGLINIYTSFWRISVSIVLTAIEVGWKQYASGRCYGQ